MRRGTLHHVIIRGIEMGGIVRGDEDRKEFLRCMGELAQAGINSPRFGLSNSVKSPAHR